MTNFHLLMCCWYISISSLPSFIYFCLLVLSFFSSLVVVSYGPNNWLSSQVGLRKQLLVYFIVYDPHKLVLSLAITWNDFLTWWYNITFTLGREEHSNTLLHSPYCSSLCARHSHVFCTLRCSNPRHTHMIPHTLRKQNIVF